MKIYYKATKPDGKDFYTGTVDYAAALESGKPLTRKPTREEYHTCSDTVYHASDTPSETLIGGTWPCRLFEVTGKPVAQQSHKLGFRSLRVVSEIEAHKALGPNGLEVVAHLEQIKMCTPEQMNRLNAVRSAAWNVAWNAALDAALDAARGAAGFAARSAAGFAARNTALGLDTARSAARDAARGAVIALVVRDLVSEKVFNTLYGPWDSVMNNYCTNCGRLKGVGCACGLTFAEKAIQIDRHSLVHERGKRRK